MHQRRRADKTVALGSRVEHLQASASRRHRFVNRQDAVAKLPSHGARQL
jgi:hypothetical protein